MNLENLSEVRLYTESGLLGHEIAGLVEEAKTLKILTISCLRFEEQLDCVRMANALRDHPCLMFIHLELEFSIGDDFAEDGSDSDPNTLASYSLAIALLSIPNLASVWTTGLRFQAETFVELATMPSISCLTLQSAALTDEHILPMVEAVMKKKGGLRLLDLSARPATEHPNVFSEEGWEALFRLADSHPRIKVTAEATYGEQDDATIVRLHNDDDVHQHFERLEISRLVRLEEAGFNELVPGESLDAEWIDVLENANNDVKALYRVLVAHPLICRSKNLLP